MAPHARDWRRRRLRTDGLLVAVAALALTAGCAAAERPVHAFFPPQSPPLGQEPRVDAAQSPVPVAARELDGVRPLYAVEELMAAGDGGGAGGGGGGGDSRGGSTARPWSVDVRGFYGPVHGFAQTPSGGNPGTTSDRRPTLGEIGIDDAFGVDATAAYRFGRDQRDRLSLNFQFVTGSGSDTLEHDLTSQAEDFPAGTHVDGSLDLSILRADYGRTFPLAGAPDEPTLALTPFVGGGAFHSSYELTGGGSRASRSFTKPFPELGVELTWRPRSGSPFDLTARVSGFVSFDNVPGFCNESLVASYRLANTGKCDVTASLGVLWEQLDFHDNEDVSNHLRFEIGPAVIVGLSIRF